MNISETEKDILLNAARKSIAALFDGDNPKPPDYEKHPILKSKSGAFVTLTIQGELKGCIGYLVGRGPLFDTVCEAAQHAAVNDPRFSALKKAELDEINIEISVLSDFYPVKSYDEIVLGKHGLLLEEGAKGLLLPQVATEHKMNKEQFLTAICHKSGLYGEYWKERMLNLKVFTADVFSEKEES